MQWAEALRLTVDMKDGKLWLQIDPDIWIWPKRARYSATDFLYNKRTNRRNDVYNNLLSGWVEAILGTSARNTDITVSPFDGGTDEENPKFTIRSRTGYTKRLL